VVYSQNSKPLLSYISIQDSEGIELEKPRKRVIEVMHA